MKDIYNIGKKQDTIQKVEFPTHREKVNVIKDLKGALGALLEKVNQIEDTVNLKPEVKVSIPDIHLDNPIKLEFPMVQKVEVINQKETKLPEVQKVQVINQPEPKDIKFPSVQKVEVTNQKEIKFPEMQRFPVGKGDIPGKADPEEYVPVRLTDGKRFYNALADAFVSATKSIFPFADSNGKPKAAQVNDDGSLTIADKIGTLVIQGQVTIGASATQFMSADTLIKNGVIVQALSTNAHVVYIGGSGVSASNGFELQAGQATSIAIDNLNKLYVAGTLNEKICYITTR